MHTIFHGIYRFFVCFFEALFFVSAGLRRGLSILFNSWDYIVISYRYVAFMMVWNLNQAALKWFWSQKELKITAIVWYIENPLYISHAVMLIFLNGFFHQKNRKSPISSKSKVQIDTLVQIQIPWDWLLKKGWWIQTRERKRERKRWSRKRGRELHIQCQGAGFHSSSWCNLQVTEGRATPNGKAITGRDVCHHRIQHTELNHSLSNHPPPLSLLGFFFFFF